MRRWRGIGAKGGVGDSFRMMEIFAWDPTGTFC